MPNNTTTAPLRILFAGTPEFAASHLQHLIDHSDANNFDIVAVYTQPDRPAGRGKKLTPSPVKQVATTHNLPIEQPVSLKPSEQQQQLANYQADVMVVVAYGLILPEPILQTPRLGCINVHASLLPRWRGAAPIQRAIEAGDSHTGITIMQMDVGLDTGDMLHKASCTITDTDTTASLHDKLMLLGHGALIHTLEQLRAGSANPEPQDHSHSCYAAKITKEEAQICWQESAQLICRKVRAFNPFPMCFSTLEGQRLRIWEADVIMDSPEPAATPGTIIEANKQGITVQAGQGAVRITQLQLPGKRAMAVADVLNANSSLFTVGLGFTP